jgi:hypothetical protein
LFEVNPIVLVQTLLIFGVGGFSNFNPKIGIDPIVYLPQAFGFFVVSEWQPKP